MSTTTPPTDAQGIQTFGQSHASPPAMPTPPVRYETPEESLRLDGPARKPESIVYSLPALVTHEDIVRLREDVSLWRADILLAIEQARREVAEIRNVIGEIRQ